MFIKVGLGSFAPLSGLAMRFLIAGPILILVARLAREPLPRSRRTWGHILFLSVMTMALPYGLIYVGETRVTSGLAAVLFSLQPLFALFFAHFMLTHERFRPAQLMGMLMGVAGVALVCLYGVHGRNEWLGAGAVLLSGAIQGFSAVYIKRHRAELPQFGTPAWGHLAGGLMLAVVALRMEPVPVRQWDAPGIVSLVYLAVFGSALAFVLVFRLFRVWEVTKTSTISLVTPPLALLWGRIFLKEPLGWNYFAGAALVVLGIWQANRVPPRSA